jgi:hypothetical protein
MLSGLFGAVVLLTWKPPRPRYPMAQQPWGSRQEFFMSDLIFVGTSVVFFVIAIWYVTGCRSLMKGERDDA